MPERAVCIGKEFWHKEPSKREKLAEFLSSRTPAAIEKRMVYSIGSRELVRKGRLDLIPWIVVPDWDHVEELMAGITGPERPFSYPNLIVRYMLYRNSPPQTVQDYVRILELAQRYGAKGVFTELPRREN